MFRRKTNPGSGPQGVNLSLIITPMLDMSFQLLAFFIMTYHPSALEGHIPGSLVPPEKVAQKGKEDNSPNPDEAPLSISEDDLLSELNEAVHIRIKAIAKGQEVGNRLEGDPNQLFIKQSTDTQQQMVADVDVPFDVALKRLDAKLKELVTTDDAKKANLKIEGDGDLRQQYVMQVYDACKRAGFDKIHFVPPPILNSKLK